VFESSNCSLDCRSDDLISGATQKQPAISGKKAGKESRITDISYCRHKDISVMYSIIACGIFEKEIEALRPVLGFPFEAHYLGAGLHVDFGDLKEALVAELDKCKTNDSEGTIVVYGQCHPDIEEIIKPYQAALTACQNCVDAFITRKGMENKAKEGLFFYLSPGWLDAWKDIFRRLNWNQEVARMQMGSFRGSVYLDTMKDAQAREEELLEFFDFTNLPFEIMPVDLGYFKSLIVNAKERLED